MSTPEGWRAPARVAVGLLLATLVAGCGESRDEGPSVEVVEEPSASTSSPDADAPSEPVGKAAGVPTRLGPGDPRPRIVCADDVRSGGIYDFGPDAKGDPTPEEAVERQVADGESFVMTENGRTAWVLRPNGTAHTRLGLVRLNGWVVDRTDGCPGGA